MRFLRRLICLLLGHEQRLLYWSGGAFSVIFGDQPNRYRCQRCGKWGDYEC